MLEHLMRFVPWVYKRPYCAHSQFLVSAFVHYVADISRRLGCLFIIQIEPTTNMLGTA